MYLDGTKGSEFPALTTMYAQLKYHTTLLTTMDMETNSPYGVPNHHAKFRDFIRE